MHRTTSPVGDSAKASIDYEALPRLHDTLTADFLLQHRILPLRLTETDAILGYWPPGPDRLALDTVALRLGRNLSLTLVEEEKAAAAARRIYGREARTADALIGSLAIERELDAEDSPIDDLLSQAHEAPVIRLVNMLLVEAIEARASDIHIEQSRVGVAVRYRIDGVLLDAPSPPAKLAPVIVSRLKIMAELDIAERRLPQDGRMRLGVAGRQLDVRVSTLPSLHGESVVLRILGSAARRLGIGDLGLPDDLRLRFLKAARTSHGIVLVTGPTGSGKTTTLYATLDEIRSGAEKILTVEDPVEYELPGAVQVSIRAGIGLTFATALRALLRQDPDIMLVGEIRDLETAEIAVHAALTGHLVLSTLHTNDAAGALTRLVDLGIEPYLISSTVQAVLAQRLVRLVCDACGQWGSPGGRQGAPAAGAGRRTDPPSDGESGRRGTGCARCRGTGYHGRTGIYELLAMDDGLRRVFGAHADIRALREKAARAGMTVLRDAAEALVAEGRTTTDEALRVIV